MKFTSRLCCCLVFLLPLIAVAANAEKLDPPAVEDGERSCAMKKPSEKKDCNRVVYVPPSRGAARNRLGGGTRGLVNQPNVESLAPDHVGITRRAEPTVAWFVSDSTDLRIDFTLVNPSLVEPLLEVTLPGPFEAGIHLVRVSDFGVRLEAGRDYDWSIAVVVNPLNRDLDVVAGGAIRWNPAAPEASAPLAAETPGYAQLASAGVWYDAVAELSLAIRSNPADADLRADRAALSEQIGSGAAAEFDRGGEPSAQPSGTE